MSSHFTWQGEDLILTCHLQPNAKQSAFAGLHGEALKIRIQAPAVDGKANAALIQFLAKAFGVVRAQIIIEQGELNRHKRVRILAPKILPKEALINQAL